MKQEVASFLNYVAASPTVFQATQQACDMLEAAHGRAPAVATGIKPCLEARHVVGLNARKHILYGRNHGNLIGSLSLAVGAVVG